VIAEEIVLQQVHLPPRDQGRRPTCIAFALSEVNLQHATNLEALSPEHLYQEAASMVPHWSPMDGIPLNLALQAASAGQPEEKDYPYQQDEPLSPVAPPPRNMTLYGARVERLPSDPGSIIKMVRNQQPIGLGLQLTQSFFCPVGGFIEFEEIALPDVLHAVAVVGLGWKDGEPHFLIRNSWGEHWGLDGSAWLPDSYVRTHTICAFGGQGGETVQRR